MVEESIQSKRQEVWTRMYDILDLNPGAPAPGGRGRVAMMIRPVISVDGLLRTAKIIKVTKSQTATTVIYHVVPEDERWLMYGYSALRQAGDRDIIGMIFGTPQALGIDLIFVDKFAAVDSRYQQFPQALPVLPGWTIRLAGSGGAADGNWDLTVYVGIERSWLT